MVLGRMHPARKVTVDVGGPKEIEIPQDSPEPLTNMSASVQQVWPALCDVSHVGCVEGMWACKAVHKHPRTGWAKVMYVMCVSHAFTCCVAALCQPLCRMCCAAFTIPQVPSVFIPKLSVSKAAAGVTPLRHPISTDEA